MGRMGMGSIFSAGVVVAALASACAHAGPGSTGPRGPTSLVDATHSIASTTQVADTSDWRGQQPQRAEELLAGRFPGVQVTRLVNGDVSVHIRGASSIMGSSEPLYVIDGLVVDPLPGRALVGINPADIARIEVLKDIGSTAMYGVRGANGVVVITTRR